MSFALTTTAIDEVALRATLERKSSGAVVTFSGVVRDHNDGRSVQDLFYECCESLAQAEARRIEEEARGEFADVDMIIVHRTGLLQIGECAVYVAAGAAHRDEAFRACRFLIEAVKHRLPIWKKETYVDGSTSWVNCREHAHAT